jgi:hypothetical protein
MFSLTQAVHKSKHLHVCSGSGHDHGVARRFRQRLRRAVRLLSGQRRRLIDLSPASATDLTLKDIAAATDELPEQVTDWAAQSQPENPPAWAADKGCWEKAKSAATQAGASDPFAFAAWWYIDHAGCAMKHARVRSGPRRCWSAVELKLGEDGALPTEFRLFRPGTNASRNGPCLFDAEAGQLVMAAYESHRRGPDGEVMDRPVIIDLEHLAVPGQAEELGVAAVPDLNPLDARGWANLELRDDGSLWAVDVTWTTDGARRLKEKTQRWISPSFWWEVLEDGQERVIEIESIGLTGKPATDGAYQLAAARSKGRRKMKLTEFLKRWKALSGAQRAMPAGDKLLQLLAIDMKTLQGVVKAMGGDPAGDITSLFATVRQFAEELKASVTGEPAPEPMPAEGGEGEGLLQAKTEDKDEDKEPMAAMRAATADLAKLRKDLDGLRGERDARIEADRVELCRQAVRTGALQPGQVWEKTDEKDQDDKPVCKPQAYLKAMTLDGIRALIKGGGGSFAPQLLSVAPRPPARDGVVATADEDIELSEYETQRLRATVDRVRAEAKLPPATDYHYTLALERYKDKRTQQLTFAQRQRQDMISRYGRKIEADMCLSTVTGTIIKDAPKLLSTPVKPIEQFGPASQRALEEFRLEYLDNLAAALDDWTTRIGDQLSSGAMDLSFPLHFQVTEYQERTAQTAATSTPQSADIKTQQREWDLAMQANLKRMMRGDFAYIRSWQQQGAQMARSRIKVRRKIVVEELEANPVWAVTKDKPNGLDTENFFTENALINPYKTSLGTWSNLSTTGRPLAPISVGADNLTAEKATFLEIPDWDGVDMGMTADEIMVPTNLGEYARLLLDVKEALIRGSLDGAGGGTMGTEPNEHKDSGVSWFVAPPLSKAGGLAANWYLVSMQIINTGKKPWVLCEGAEEEIREWGTDSDFYKNGPGDIKVQSCIELCIVLLYRHGIRRINGS